MGLQKMSCKGSFKMKAFAVYKLYLVLCLCREQWSPNIRRDCYFLPFEHWNRGFESRSVLVCVGLCVALREDHFRTCSPRSPDKHQQGKTRKQL